MHARAPLSFASLVFLAGAIAGCETTPPAVDGGDPGNDSGRIDGGGEEPDAFREDAGAPLDSGAPPDAPDEACDTPGAIETVACGMCGTVERFCSAAGAWSYGVCSDEGACAPGTTQETDCGMCGTRMQRCTTACAWEDVGACTGEGECAPGATVRAGTGCPAGQLRDFTCSDACVLEPTSACAADSCPTPGAIESVACGMCGTRERFCTASSVWSYGPCEDEGECMPGATGTGTCGRCGMQATVCDSACTWQPFGACTGLEACCVPETEEVDLLLMMDNSNSMAEEQASLTAELPGIVRALATGDTDGDGVADFTPIGSLHAGVISSDMGTGTARVPTCDRGTFGGMFGDDGVLITRGRTSIAGCVATYPAVFDFDPTTDSPDTFARDLSCVATLGTGGCGFEQQLEAVLKAVSPAMATAWTAPGFTAPTFFSGTSGHALGSNAGFLRDDSLLTIVIVTDEEDCSALDPDVFDPSSPTYTSDLNLRCFTYPSALHPTARYVDGIAQLRIDPERIVVASIVGIPIAVDPTTTVPDYATILAHPDMTEMVDPAMTTRLRPSCNTARGLAFPPRRILSVQRDLEARGIATTTGSICQSSFSAVTGRILERIADRLAGTCP